MAEFRAPGEELYYLEANEARRAWLVPDILSKYEDGTYTIQDAIEVALAVGFSEAVRTIRELDAEEPFYEL